MGAVDLSNRSNAFESTPISHLRKIAGANAGIELLFCKLMLKITVI